MSDGIPIYVQLRDQIRALILCGDLSPAYKLPSVRQLASYLSINRHTVSRALDDLEKEGLIVREVGKGTFVANVQQSDNTRDVERFEQIVREAITRSQSLGYSSEELAEAILASTDVSRQNSDVSLSIGFIECNWTSAYRYAVDLRNELGIEVDPLLLSEIQESIAAGKAPIQRYDLIVTTVGHFPEVRRALGPEARIYSITGGPYMKVFFEVLALPANHRIGIVTASNVGSVGMKNAMVQAGIPDKRITLASLEQPEEIAELINAVDTLVISNTAIDSLKELLAGASVHILEYHNQLDASGVEALRQVAGDLMYEKSTTARRQLSGMRAVSHSDLQRAFLKHA